MAFLKRKERKGKEELTDFVYGFGSDPISRLPIGVRGKEDDRYRIRGGVVGQEPQTLTPRYQVYLQ
jgi:hypothetical protein